MKHANSGSFTKGQIPWMKGKHHSEESKKKLSDGRKGKLHWGFGKHFSEERKRKISEALKGKPKSLKVRQAVAEANRRRILTDEQRKKMSELRKGSKSNFWKGGKTALVARLKNSVEWKLWREAVYKRDNFTCQYCFRHGGDLEPHHIKKLSKNLEIAFELSNGITLCTLCHRKTFNREEEFELIFIKTLCASK
jgi:hypothetical protein